MTFLYICPMIITISIQSKYRKDMGTDVTKHGDGRYIKYLLTLMPMEMHICKYFYVKSTIKSLLDIYALILIILC